MSSRVDSILITDFICSADLFLGFGWKRLGEILPVPDCEVNVRARCNSPREMMLSPPADSRTSRLQRWKDRLLAVC